MKKLLAITLSILMTFGMMSNNVLAEEKITFSDISGHWAEQDIKKIASEGIISGYPDGTFKPDAPITRAEFAKIATLAFELVTDSDLSEYNDLNSNEWYYEYITKAANYIPKYKLPVDYPCMTPYENNANGGFLPNNEAIRMHIAEALVEITLEKEPTYIENLSIQEINSQVQESFKDTEYKNLMAFPGTGIPINVQRMNKYTWLSSELGIMQGDDNGNFNPYGYVTRAELVTMIKRMIVKVSATYEYITPLGTITSKTDYSSHINFATEANVRIDIIKDTENFDKTRYIVSGPFKAFTDQQSSMYITFDSFAKIFNGEWKLNNNVFEFTYDTSKEVVLDQYTPNETSGEWPNKTGSTPVVSFSEIPTIFVNGEEKAVKGSYGGKVYNSCLMMYNNELYIPVQMIAELLDYDISVTDIIWN